MHVSGRMTLRLEKGIEVPERAFHEPVSGHFVESHLKENSSEKLSYFQQGVAMSTVTHLTNCIKVVYLELSVFPTSSS